MINSQLRWNLGPGHAKYLESNKNYKNLRSLYGVMRGEKITKQNGFKLTENN